MPLDLRGFMGEPEKWTGLYHAADQLEKRKLRADQLALQREGRRASAGTFLQNYLDPKDFLTGTDYDPLLLQGLESAMQQGSSLAASGADSPMLMMALGPMVNKLSRYSSNAKNITKQVDDYIGKMKESGIIGYDFAKLKDEAVRSAFYKTDPNTGQSALDPDSVDPSINWVEKTIQDSPEKITTTTGWDTFADKAKINSELQNITDYDRFGNMDKHAVNLKYQEYMVPEWDKGKVTGFVPKYDTALEGRNALMHDFVQPDGTIKKAPVRILDEGIYKGLPKPLLDDIRGKLKQEIKSYKTATGEDISLNSPKAQMVARALAYDELNRKQRNYGHIGETAVNDKLSQPVVNLHVQQTDAYLQNEKDKAASRKAGRVSVSDPNDPDRLKRNFAQAFGDVFTGKEDLSKYSTESLAGNLTYLNNQSKAIKGLRVKDISPSMPDGLLKAGKASPYEYKRVFYRPEERTLIVEREESKSGGKHTSYLAIPEAQVGSFIDRIAEANGLNKLEVNTWLEKIGYANGKFGGGAQSAPTTPVAPAATPGTPNAAASDFEKRKKSWQDAAKTSTDKLKKPFPKK